MKHLNNTVSLAACCMIVLLAGCAGVRETAKGVAGVSTKALEDGRANAIKKTFSVDYAKCRDMVNEVLKENSVYVYARDEAKKMIAFYLTESDTTPVGVFFTALNDTSTEVAVTSPSRYSKEFIADKISARFEKPAKPVKAKPAAGGAEQPAKAQKK
jgi:hypothetical protein